MAPMCMPPGTKSARRDGSRWSSAWGWGESLRRGWGRAAWFGGKKGAPRREVVRRTKGGAGIVVSCGGSDEKGWRTELELGRGKSLDDHHAAATLGTEPKCAGFLDRGGFRFGRRWRYCSEELQAKRQESGAPPVG